MRGSGRFSVAIAVEANLGFDSVQDVSAAIGSVWILGSTRVFMPVHRLWK